MKPGIYEHRHPDFQYILSRQHFPQDSHLLEALKASEGLMHPVAKESLLDMSSTLVCAAVRRCFDKDTRCYYIRDIYSTYIRLWAKARGTASDQMKSAFLTSYYSSNTDCSERLVNLLNGYRLSKHSGERLEVNPQTGMTCRMVNEVEREAAQFVIATIGFGQTACFRLSELPGQYLHMLLESDCYCVYSEDGPTFDTAPGCLEIV